MPRYSHQLLAMLRFLRVLTKWLFRAIRRRLAAHPAKADRNKVPSCRRKLPQPPRHWRRKPPWVVKTLIQLQARLGLSCAKLAAHFNRLFAKARRMTVSRSWVADKLREHAHEIAGLRERCKRRIPPETPPNDNWGIDLTGKTDAQRRLHSIVAVIDHGSRRALVLESTDDRTAAAMLKVMLAAVDQFGTPRVLRSDNESIFRSRVFVEGMKALGIRQKFSKPGHPWENPYVERLFGTLKQTLNQLVVPNAEALKHVIEVFKGWYNEVRPHNHLNGLTPLEAWAGVDPYRVAPKSIEIVDELDGLLTGIRIRR